MQLIHSITEMQSYSSVWQQAGLKIAFVPTMGNLHAGHLSLVEKAMEVADRVVLSIFVNPLQFNENSDFEAYPRTLDADMQKLDGYRVDALFAPGENDLYPQGREQVTLVDVPELSTILEGSSRPGHFRGVATVVAKLFNCVLPQVAIFGEKDFQQLLVVQRMVADLNFPIEIIGMPTRREQDGLAMSSRNSRMSTEERQKAPALYRTLRTLCDKILAGEHDFAQLESQAMEQIAAEGMSPEYIRVRSAKDLGTPQIAADLVIVAAARLGQTRLIDNIRI
ncbi:MAG: pantoate--beta-alanine ligase [Gammaproteobacteria bacterium]|nr:pantoate--beta-alanine ligase [Gammaproteobacteria bacterium]